MVCEGEKAWSSQRFPFPSMEQGVAAPSRWGESETVMEELRGRPEYCLDLSFMYALLRLGYEFGEERGVRIGKKVRFFFSFLSFAICFLTRFAWPQVRGTELGWCLGATLGMLGSAEYECRA